MVVESLPGLAHVYMSISAEINADNVYTKRLRIILANIMKADQWKLETKKTSSMYQSDLVSTGSQNKTRLGLCEGYVVRVCVFFYKKKKFLAILHFCFLLLDNQGITRVNICRYNLSWI